MSKKMITLRSSDGVRFEVEEAMAIQSEMIKSMINSDCTVDDILLANVKSDIMPKLIEYMKKHADQNGDDSSSSRDIAEWDSEFISNVEHDVLYNLLMASNYLEMKNLLDLAVKRVADLIKGKTPEQIRETFNIDKDFSPEQEEAIRNENRWAFE